MIVVGIDPGLTGAVAAYDAEAGAGTVWDIPTYDTQRKSKVKRIVDARRLSDIFDEIIDRDADVHFVLEAVASMPNQGVASVFSLGDTFGCIRGVLGALGYQVITPVPGVWKRRMGLDSDKNKSLALARELFPTIQDLKRKKDHNRAEALLLAVWHANDLGAE